MPPRSTRLTRPLPSPAQVLYGVADDGAAVELRCADHHLVEHLEPVWPPIGLRRHARHLDVPAATVVELSGSVSAPEVSIDGTPSRHGWDGVESALGLFAAERLAGLVAVHAAVLVWDGAAVIVPGPSYAGKSTLTVAAAAAGATVASDEFALVDPQTGLVRGWNRRVRVRTRSGIERAELAVDIEPTRVGVVAAVAYGEGEQMLRELSPAETALAILANTVCAQSRPLEAIAAATTLARTACGVGGTRGEATEAAEVLRDMCRSGSFDRVTRLATTEEYIAPSSTGVLQVE